MSASTPPTPTQTLDLCKYHRRHNQQVRLMPEDNFVSLKKKLPCIMEPHKLVSVIGFPHASSQCLSQCCQDNINTCADIPKGAVYLSKPAPRTGTASFPHIITTEWINPHIPPILTSMLFTFPKIYVFR
ncbi:hypothetical protein Plhal703r1_c01g0000081 [Plasmopara halstedii]